MCVMEQETPFLNKTSKVKDFKKTTLNLQKKSVFSVKDTIDIALREMTGQEKISRSY